MPVPNIDKLLSNIRADILIWEKADPQSRQEHETAERITADVAALDKHLTEGGMPPRAWLSVAEARSRALRHPETEPVVTGSGNLMGSQT